MRNVNCQSLPRENARASGTLFRGTPMACARTKSPVNSALLKEYRRRILAKLAYPTTTEGFAADKQRLEPASAQATKYRQDIEDKLFGRHW
jgi:hypothetical protein